MIVKGLHGHTPETIRWKLLTNALLRSLVSDFGYGLYMAKAMQLANIVRRIRNSNGLNNGLRNSINYCRFTLTK